MRAGFWSAMKRLPATTIFLGSFLAFLVQPLTARALLPAFGGTASVWVTCLAAFQVLLVAGYAYAHILVPGKVRLHLALLVAAAAWLALLSFFFPAVAGHIGGCGIPVSGTLAAVALLAGGPYVLFAANASVVQRMAGGEYRLYAISNVGSFAGLFVHPLVLEPFVPVEWQWRAMAMATMAYTVLLLMMARGSTEGKVAAIDTTGRRPRERLSPFVVLVPAVSCFMLNAATAHATANIVPLPLMWAALLGVYLLTYAVGFSSWGEKMMPVWGMLGLAAAGVAAFARFGTALSATRVAAEMGALLSVVFFGGTALHAWLCSLRPAAASLTRYNLSIAAGGAAGGLVAGIAAPLATDSILEWPVALVATAGLLAFMLRGWAMRRLGADGTWTAKAAICVFSAVSIIAWIGEKESRRGDLARGRSFYGTWRVYRETTRNAYGKAVDVYGFRHGGTLHGFESVDPLYRDVATAYYGAGGGGLAFTTHPAYKAGRQVRAGMVGLGIGTMAFYGRKGDTLRFYEICPQVTAVARGPWFDYLGSCSSRVDVVQGDARRTLEDERAAGAAKWDILVVDAYSGDSIPLQLVTEEAFLLYRERLAAGGTLALHLSNWHVDLVPAAKAAAILLGLHCQVVTESAKGFSSASTWALLSEYPLELPPGTETVSLDEVPDKELPRDNCGGLLPFVRIML